MMKHAFHIALFFAVLSAHLWFTYKLGAYCWGKLRNGASYGATILSAFVLLGCVGYFFGTLVIFWWVGMLVFGLD
jgi:hypothetical protein